MSILSQIAVVFLLAILAVVFLIMLRRGGNVSRRSGLSENADVPRPSFQWPDWNEEGKKEKHPNKGTVLLPMLYVDQLDPATMKRVSRFSVCDIPENGVGISRPNADKGDIFLSGKTKTALTVSENHALIGIDDSGLFLQDNYSSNHTYREDGKTRIDEVDITDGLILYLGSQPVRFSLPGCQEVLGTEETRIHNAPEEKKTLSQMYQDQADVKRKSMPLRRRKAS